MGRNIHHTILKRDKFQFIVNVMDLNIMDYHETVEIYKQKMKESI